MSVVGEAIAGAALSALFDALFNKLVSSELLNFATEAEVREEIKRWDKMMRKLRLVLDDAEEKQIEDGLVKEWLRDLKHLAYDVEDILDEFSTECLRRKVNGERKAASTSRIHKFIPACCSSFTPRTFKFNYGMVSKIKEITTRFEGILKDMDDMKLVENVCKTSTKVWQRPPSSCVQDEPTVYGREGDKDKILDLLFRCETDYAKVGVIPIVGMGGMGKTTLAKLVYNDDSMLNHYFQVKAWVCVSDIFDIIKVTKGILESITSKSSELKEFSEMQVELNRQLAGKKFLLVLDDVWTENYDDWHILRSALMGGAPGSKIIVTTRNTAVAKMVGTIDCYELKRISNDDCWLLFAKHAFENRSIVAQPELEKIGREIVDKRCGGLPLAARTLGGLLRSKERHNEWEQVLNNKLWSLGNRSNNILPVLKLSYYYLPSHLKRCFAYCAIFPKDYEFTQKEIILLWMAEDLIPQGDDKREMEDLGNDYFHELLSRSFFQASHSHQSLFVMHDLVNDLAQKIAEDVCLRLEDEFNVGENFTRERIRHCSFIQSNFDGIKRFASFDKMKCLRTFLPFSLQMSFNCCRGDCVPYDLLQNLKFLRVLSFCHYNIEELPDSIGDLKHLRYLDLSRTEIEVLPESTTSLCNLQTLILMGCQKLKKLPERMDYLICLRHLDLTFVHLVEGMPLEIKELSGLRTLSEIAIHKGSFTVTNLMNLKSLRGELSISNLDAIVDASDVPMSKILRDKDRIDVLKLMWSEHNFGDRRYQYDILDGLQGHINLKKLRICYYGGERFPSWIGEPMFKNIVEIRLDDCRMCKSLPQLGMLPNLKELFIIGMSSLESIDQEFYGNNCSNPFPCLEVLCFQEMQNWEEWDACEFGFQVLRELSIANCGKLSGKLPSHLPSLEKLIIIGCENFAAALPSLPKLSALEIKGWKEVDFRDKVDFSALTMLSLYDVSSVTNLGVGFLHGLKKFKTLKLSNIESTDGIPSNLSIPYRNEAISNLECVFRRCPQLISMAVDEGNQDLQMDLAGSELECLTIDGCGELEKLPTWIQKLMFLRYLTIGRCKSLVAISEGCLPSLIKVVTIWGCRSLAVIAMYDNQYLEKLDICGCRSLVSLGRRQLPPTLKKLSIELCEKLKSLLHEEDKGEISSSSSSTCNLEDLEIRNCKSLTSISCGSELPTTLKCLVIEKCSNLVSILPRGKLPKLQLLNIHSCEKLESIAEGFECIASLETLSIKSCSSLKSLPDGLHNQSNLCDFEINNCQSIVSFPRGGLPTASLRKLEIAALEKLEACPDNLHRLSSLKELKISFCPSLVCFPSHGLPFNLTSLTIKSMENCKPLFEWELDRLKSLRELYIEGESGEMRSFPSDEAGMTLPSSLIHLRVFWFPNLERLSTRGFRNVTSLQYLWISYCPKLAFLPENGLPDSLLELHVGCCPILKQRCEEGGPEWSKIVNIPIAQIVDFFA